MKKITFPRSKQVPQEQKYPYINTQGFKKLWNLFVAITETDEFNEWIIKIRENYKIPEGGFKNDKQVKAWQDLAGGYLDGLKQYLEISTEIEKICNKLNFKFLFSEELINHYLLFNERNYNKLSEIYNLCHITDLGEKENLYTRIVEKKDVYPITMGISPYASLRDILDYVKKVYKIKNKTATGKI